MSMHDERWTLGVAENGDVRLRDVKTGETWRFGGPRALFDALGKLADWREAWSSEGAWERFRASQERYRQVVESTGEVPPRPTEAEYGSLPVLDPRTLTDNSHYGATPDAELDLRTCCSTLKTHAHGDWCRNTDNTQKSYGVASRKPGAAHAAHCDGWMGGTCSPTCPARPEPHNADDGAFPEWRARTAGGSGAGQ